MAHVFLKAEKIVSQGLGMLQRDLVLPRLVTRYNSADFVGAKNDTVNVKIPAILQGRQYEWRTRNAPIVFDDLEELSLPLTLDQHLYSGIAITDEQLTLDIVSWGTQVATPQIRAVAEKSEQLIAAAMEDANYRNEVTYTAGDPSDGNDMTFFGTLIDAGNYLDIENVPLSGRVALLGANVWAAAARSPHLVKVNEAGSSSALRDATLGEIAGFTIVKSNSIDRDFAVAYHPSAFAFANLAPRVPDGATAGAVGTFEGFSMRWIKDYDPNYLRDRSVYSTFAAAMSIEDGRDLESPVGSGFGELTDENVRAVKINFTPFT